MTIPNQLTVTRIILTPLFAFLFLSSNKTLNQISLFVFLIAALTDWYDGWLARKYNYISELGKFLDPLADKILTSTAFFLFVYIDILNFWMVLIIVIRDLLVTLLRVYGQYKKRAFSTSFLAKLKTSLQMIFLYYLLFIYIGLEKDLFTFIDKNWARVLLNDKLINYSILFITALTVYTGIEYLYTNRFTIKEIFK
ncbi:MAG: CDP-diacylglycerol--glycerol-3-phosphate 3-phosphatidyltransferase [Ignavibacteria bacterium]|jgi:CDP-diacylglycerol--glycerol-3-phosphate 3-phosphatidyltransferase|nr:CDP-diacylglycerol--glycerol-3-phosphate 3-phosphatidyltransferase [Ignavibacteria bacterium]MDH7528009.1 CDP-diacylglycerol--glycerol-3-phosphate 3-phosphatidyltransferase [Ignavibacteria bacterium]